MFCSQSELFPLLRFGIKKERYKAEEEQFDT